MSKATIGNTMRNAIAGSLLGICIGGSIAHEIILDALIKNAPRVPNVTRGLVYGHNEHGGIFYLSAGQSLGLNLDFFMIIFFFLALLIGPKKNIKKRTFSANWQLDDLYHIQKAFIVISAVLTLWIARDRGMQILDWLAKFGIGVSNETI